MTTPRRAGTIRALTLDLDDTLWPVWPTIQRAERELHDWLSQHAAPTAERFDVGALRGLREAVARDHPEWRHDFSRMRHESLVRALTLAGDDAALADPAFAVFLAARNRVELFDDALPVLAALAARWPIVAVTNGNADLHGIGLAGHFVASVSARLRKRCCTSVTTGRSMSSARTAPACARPGCGVTKRPRRRPTAPWRRTASCAICTSCSRGWTPERAVPAR